jgi:hypothetical protein
MEAAEGNGSLSGDQGSLSDTTIEDSLKNAMIKASSEEGAVSTSNQNEHVSTVELSLTILL